MSVESTQENGIAFSKSDLELAGCLRRLLKSRFILRTQNEKWFQAIVDRKSELQKILDPMGVHLEIHEALQVAYLNPNNPEFEGALDYQLGRKKTLSAFASALVIYLRHQRLQYFTNPTPDPIPIIEVLNMREYLEKFNTTNIDNQFERSFRRALAELEELQILIETKKDSGIYEISPLCELLLSQENMAIIQTKMKDYFLNSKEESISHA